VPAAHWVPAAVVDGHRDPAGHVVQLVVDPVEKVPAEQTVAANPPTQARPAAHAEQIATPCADSSPSLHGAGASAGSTQLWPTGHDRHAVDPAGA
jgi:hypothetical protein